MLFSTLLLSFSPRYRRNKLPKVKNTPTPQNATMSKINTCLLLHTAGFPPSLLLLLLGPLLVFCGKRRGLLLPPLKPPLFLFSCVVFVAPFIVYCTNNNTRCAPSIYGKLRYVYTIINCTYTYLYMLHTDYELTKFSTTRKSRNILVFQ